MLCLLVYLCRRLLSAPDILDILRQVAVVSKAAK